MQSHSCASCWGRDIFSGNRVLSVFHSVAKLSVPHSWESLNLPFNNHRGAGGSGACGTPHRRTWFSSHFVLLIWTWQEGFVDHNINLLYGAPMLQGHWEVVSGIWQVFWAPIASYQKNSKKEGSPIRADRRTRSPMQMTCKAEPL